MIRVQKFTFNGFQENTYLIINEKAEALVVDPGNSNAEENDTLLSFIKNQQLSLKAVLNTHCHLDHVLGNSYCKEQFEIPLYIPKGEQEVLKSMEVIAPAWGAPNYQPATPDGFIEEIELGKIWNFKTLFVPGHAPGHLAFFFESEKILLGGDVLFKGSIGRYDLPGGNLDTLLNSIRQQLFSLPDDTVVYSGHGPETTIGEEKSHNPFLQ